MSTNFRDLMRTAWAKAEGIPPDGVEDCREELMDDMQGIFQCFAQLIIQDYVSNGKNASISTN